MSDKSNKYGYVGPEVTQAFKANKGIFDMAEINNLVSENKWTSFGQLELIETKTVSSQNSVDFTNIKQDIYNVHFFTWNNVIITTGGIPADGIRLYENGVVESAGVYQYAFQYCGTTGTFGEAQSTGSNKLFSLNGGSGNAETYGYSYLYNLGDSSKYSFSTFANFQIIQGRVNSFAQFGSAVLPQASSVDGIQYVQNQTNAMSGTFSLYGIRYS